MRIFLDTCALFKLYHLESDSYLIERIFIENPISKVFLSDLTKLEFSSTLWKKVRTKEITGTQAKKTISSFEDDVNKFHFIPIDELIVNNAIKLVSKYGETGLRTLDGIQLSTATYLKNQADLFITADKLLLSFFSAEKLTTSV